MYAVKYLIHFDDVCVIFFSRKFLLNQDLESEVESQLIRSVPQQPIFNHSRNMLAVTIHESEN